jgi:hypothetical protein
MKKMLCAAAAAILAGCAGPQASVGSAPAARTAASSAYYCAKERLSVDAGRLECNWQPSAEEACKFAEVTTLARAELANDPQPAGPLQHGPVAGEGLTALRHWSERDHALRTFKAAQGRA